MLSKKPMSQMFFIYLSLMLLLTGGLLIQTSAAAAFNPTNRPRLS